MRNQFLLKKPRKSSFVRSLAILLAVAFVGLGIVMFVEALIYPWARSLTGGPTLAGEWYGEMTTPTGQRRVVRVVIDAGAGCGGNCPDITGAATWCDKSNGILEHELWGDTQNWRGTKFFVKTRQLEDRPVELRLGDLQGEWNTDKLRLTTTLRSDTYNYSISSEKDDAGNETTTLVGAHPDTVSPVTFPLHRGSKQDFLTACRQLK